MRIKDATVFYLSPGLFQEESFLLIFVNHFIKGFFTELGQKLTLDQLELVVHRARFSIRTALQAHAAGGKQLIPINCPDDLDQENRTVVHEIESAPRSLYGSQYLFA